MITSYRTGQNLSDVARIRRGEIATNSNFESGFDTWYDGGGDVQWLRRTGSTPSAGTGPASAQSGNYYMYCETSGNDNEYKSYYLVKDAKNMISIDYYYHLWMDSNTCTVDPYLALEKWHGGNWIELWRVQGCQGNGWIHNTLQLGYANKIRFKGFSSGPLPWPDDPFGYKGDMSIDNITITGMT